jgi:hypothetical protein
LTVAFLLALSGLGYDIFVILSGHGYSPGGTREDVFQRSSLKHGVYVPFAALAEILFTVAEWQASLVDYGSVCATETLSSTLTVKRKQAARLSFPLSAGSSTRWM